MDRDTDTETGRQACRLTEVHRPSDRRTEMSAGGPFSRRDLRFLSFRKWVRTKRVFYYKRAAGESRDSALTRPRQG